MTVNFLGIDPGFSKIGIAQISYLYRTEKFISLAKAIPSIRSTRLELDIRGWGDMKSFRELQSQCAKAIFGIAGAELTKTITCIGIEKPMAFLGKGSGTYIHYGYSLILRMIMDYYPEDRIRVYTPAMAKKHLTGAAGAKKEMIPAFIQKRFNIIPPTLDEADAISIAYAAAREWELGTPQFLKSLKMQIKDFSFISREKK